MNPSNLNSTSKFAISNHKLKLQLRSPSKKVIAYTIPEINNLIASINIAERKSIIKKEIKLTRKLVVIHSKNSCPYCTLCCEDECFKTQ